MYSYEDPVLTKSKKRKYSQQAPKETTPSALSVGKWGHDKWDEGSQLGRSDTNQAPKRQKLTPSAQAFSVSQWTPGCAEWPTLEESAEPLLIKKFKVLDVKSLINAINTLAKIMEKIDLGSADARQIYNNCISSWIEVASSKLQNFDRIAFANSISALVKLGYYDRDFIKKWIDAASNKLEKFYQQELSNSMWALAKLGYYDEAFTKKWIDAASNKLEKFYQQELSNSMWALAKLGYYDEDFTKKWLKQAIYRLSGFNAQGLTNSIWALATLVHYDRDFIKKWIDAASNKLGGFNEQGLANSIWALAKLGYKDEAFIEKWLYAAHDKLYQFNEQELVNSIWALATLVHYDEAFIQEWRSQAIKKLSGFNERGLSNSMLALANLEYYDQYFIQECLSEAIKKLDKFNAQELVNSIWALAKLEYKNKAFIQAWLNQAIYQLDKFNAQNFSNSIWALATLGYYDEEFIQAWLNQAIYQLDEFNEQNFSNSIWALAKLGYYDEAFTKKWIDAASNKLGGFNEQGLANSIWALATLVHYDEAFIKKWIDAASNKLGGFNEQGLSNSIWALAKLVHYDEAFIQEWLDTASNKLDEFNAQGLSNSIWALATLVHYDEAFTKKWIDAASNKLGGFNEQELSNSIWALATLGYDNQYFIQEWLAAASNKLDEFNEQGLSNSIWALAKLVHYDEAFIQEWLAAASNKLDEFNEQGLSNSIWALATLGYDNQYFIQQWLDTASNKLGGFNAQDLANSIWALAHFYIHEEDSDIYNGIKRLMKKVDEVIENVHQEPTTCKRQVAQAFYLLNRQDQQEFKAISERLEAWHNDFKQEETTISQHQKKVFDCEVLKQCKQEYYIDEVCGRVDGYLQRKLSGREYDIIVQVDEPSHFNIDSAGQESYNLQTLFNNYILEQYGYMLLRLSYKEIDARSPEDLNDYISKKIPNLIDYKVKVTNDVALSANKPFVVLTCLHDCPIFNMPYLGEVLPKNNQAAGIVGENQIINLLNFMDSSFHRNENLPHSGTGDGANSIIIETKHNNSAINTFFNQPAIKSLFFTLGAFNYNKIGQVIEHFGCELTIIYRYTTPDGHKASYVGRFGKALSNNNDTVIGDITQSLKNLTFNALEPIHVDESFAYINLVPVSRDPITLISDENGFRVASEEEIREQALREIAQSGVRVQVNEISVEHVGDFTLKDLVFEMVTM